MLVRAAGWRFVISLVLPLMNQRPSRVRYQLLFSSITRAEGTRRRKRASFAWHGNREIKDYPCGRGREQVESGLVLMPEFAYIEAGGGLSFLRLYLWARISGSPGAIAEDAYLTWCR